VTQPEPGSRSPFGLQLIGGFKVVCAVLLIALGFGVFRNVAGDPRDEAEHFVEKIKLDKDNQFIHSVIERVSNLTPGQLKAIGVGTFLYALLYLVEGIGLLLKKHWAEYFTVIATGIFIPVEIWEVYHHVTPIRLAILAINVAIVAYLVVTLLRRDRPKAAGVD